MEHTLKRNLLGYFQKIENPTEEEKKLLHSLQDSCEYFDISCIHRDDVKYTGYDGDKLDDSDMERLANKMNDYHWNMAIVRIWNSLVKNLKSRNYENEKIQNS